MAAQNRGSMETILTFDNLDVSQWSMVWSTAHIPGMDNAAGGNTQVGLKGRKKLRLGSLALGAFLTMHCRVAASALTGGFFIFMLFLIMATALLANPLRHFEVYLGQWSISGPGRAYRILPIFEGVGLAICINALVRAILCCTMAAISVVYVVNSAGDSKLPFTYCRDFNLKPYEPVLKDLTLSMLKENNSEFSFQTADITNTNLMKEDFTVGTKEFAWRNLPNYSLVKMRQKINFTYKNDHHKIEVCNESYSKGYPVMYSTPAYNFFYVEVVLYREDFIFEQFNVALSFALLLLWTVMWIILLTERLTHKRLIWNNTYSWLVIVPWIWTALLLFVALTNLATLPKGFRKVFNIGAKEVLSALADALEVAMYVHSAGVGTEMIFGKGLNHYAMGHIDPLLNGENVWHSGLLYLLTGLHSVGAAVCSLVDGVYPHNETIKIQESTLWIFPMYSKCTLIHNYSHILSTFIFTGLTISYTTVAFIFVKTALHIIFEYKVKLVFVEQAVVAVTMLSCMGLSLIFATNNGVAFLESIDAVMSGIAMPLICLLEVFPLMYLYRAHDFLSDMNVATEDNACSSRISTQWQLIPFILLITVLMKICALWSSELPRAGACAAAALLATTLLAPVLRALRNVYKFVRARRTNK